MWFHTACASSRVVFMIFSLVRVPPTAFRAVLQKTIHLSLSLWQHQRAHKLESEPEAKRFEESEAMEMLFGA